MCFVQSYNFKKGIEVFGAAGEASALKEMKQLHEREAGYPVELRDLTDEEARRALEVVDIMLQKRDSTVKARACINGSKQRNWMNKDEVSSPTPVPESIIVTGLIDAKERRYTACADVPNAFIQSVLEHNPGDPHVIMKLRGILVDIMCKIAPDLYAPFVHVDSKGRKILYLAVTKAVYGMIQSPMLWYNKFVKDVTENGFKLNPYDPCVANKMVKGKQLTIVWHVDDVKISSVDKQAVEDFIDWLNKKYSDEKGKVTVSRGKRHDYLGMVLDYSVDGALIIDMKDYVSKMLKEFEEKFPLKSSKGPWNDKLQEVDEKSPKLEPKQREIFHTFVAKGLFLAKRGRPDLLPAISFLCSRVKDATKQDSLKLIHMLQFLKRTKDVVLTLTVDNLDLVLHWYWDASFATHPDFKSHTGGALTFGKGVAIAHSKKQKINTDSSTYAEMVAVYDGMNPMLWLSLFLKAQGVKVEDTILYQDNKSAILLQKNGKSSSTKRTRHMNIKYFYVKDQVDQGHIKIAYCPTDKMIADYFTKPTTGSTFIALWELVMNCPFPTTQCEDTGDKS